MTMTAEELTSEGQHTIPMEGDDITPKKDGGVLKVIRCLVTLYALIRHLSVYLAARCLLAGLG